MQHILDIESLSAHDIMTLIHRAKAFEEGGARPDFHQYPVALMFYENSTRTRVSFELAAKYLNMPTIVIDKNTSSEQKGEHVFDTVANLIAMGIHHFIIRHQQDGLQGLLAAEFSHKAHIINAGDGRRAHPSQALLDMMTILNHKKDLSCLKIAVVGNISHSRVASSFQVICKKLGVGELVLVAPPMWQPDHCHYGRISHDLYDGLEGADVVMTLRVQKERLESLDNLDLEAYRKQYALTQEVLSFCKKDAIIMHPGPINRGVEIDSDVADGSQSVILEQVHHGVYIRMAMLEALVSG